MRGKETGNSVVIPGGEVNSGERDGKLCVDCVVVHSRMERQLCLFRPNLVYVIILLLYDFLPVRGSTICRGRELRKLDEKCEQI